MKKAEIVVGATYGNGKAGKLRRLRRVLAVGPQYKLYDGQTETDCLSYAIVKGAKEAYPRGTTPEGEQIMHSTRTSFASWAKDRVEV